MRVELLLLVFSVEGENAIGKAKDTGDSILMRGVGLRVLPVPVHNLDCAYWGETCVAIGRD